MDHPHDFPGPNPAPNTAFRLLGFSALVTKRKRVREKAALQKSRNPGPTVETIQRHTSRCPCKKRPPLPVCFPRAYTCSHASSSPSQTLSLESFSLIFAVMISKNSLKSSMPWPCELPLLSKSDLSFTTMGITACDRRSGWGCTLVGLGFPWS